MLRRATDAIRAAWRELAQASALLLGWALFTAGLARLTVPEVWLLSGGLLLLSACGWRWLYVFFGRGMYALSEDGDE